VDERNAAASLGLALQEGDDLADRSDGRMGVLLRDDTRCRSVPKRDPDRPFFSLCASEGPFGTGRQDGSRRHGLVSGNIAKLSHDAVRVETPVAIVGVRGPQFLVKVETQ